MQIAKNLQQSVGSPVSPTSQISKSQKSKLTPQQKHQRQPSYASSNNSYKDANASLASSGDIAVLPNSSSYLDCAFNEKLSQHSLDSHNSNIDINLISSPTSSSFSQADYIDEVNLIRFLLLFTLLTNTNRD